MSDDGSGGENASDDENDENGADRSGDAGGSDADRRVVIDFTDTAELTIEALDVGVADEAISFDVTGSISGVPVETLDRLSNAELTPAELVFVVEDAS